MHEDAYGMIKYLRAKEDTGALVILWDEINWLGFRLHIKVGFEMWKRVIKPELQKFVPHSFGNRVLFESEPSSQRIFLYHCYAPGPHSVGGSIPLNDL